MLYKILYIFVVKCEPLSFVTASSVSDPVSYLHCEAHGCKQKVSKWPTLGNAEPNTQQASFCIPVADANQGTEEAARPDWTRLLHNAMESYLSQLVAKRSSLSLYISVDIVKFGP